MRRLARPWVFAAVAVVLVVGVKYAWEEGAPPFGPGPDDWTGVFLSNNQAYFGHFYSGPGDYARLRDVHYVITTQLQSQDPQATPQTQLVVQRLGGEIHGPKPEMRISKTQILFTEALRPDSPVRQAIRSQNTGR